MSAAVRISDFYPHTTKKLSATCTIGGVAQNITDDTVTLTMKLAKADADSAVVLTSTADVASQGADGIALFDLSPALTTIAPHVGYFCDITWVRNGGAEYVIYSDVVTVLDRTSDV